MILGYYRVDRFRGEICVLREAKQVISQVQGTVFLRYVCQEDFSRTYDPRVLKWKNTTVSSVSYYFV